jgi:hypothetical protein
MQKEICQLLRDIIDARATYDLIPLLNCLLSCCFLVFGLSSPMLPRLHPGGAHRRAHCLRYAFVGVSLVLSHLHLRLLQPEGYRWWFCEGS